MCVQAVACVYVEETAGMCVNELGLKSNTLAMQKSYGPAFVFLHLLIMYTCV